MIKSKKLKYSTYECPQNRILICKIQDKHYSVIKIVLHYVTIITINPWINYELQFLLNRWGTCEIREHKYIMYLNLIHYIARYLKYHTCKSETSSRHNTIS